MADNPDLVNELFEALADLLVENRALDAALEVAKQHLPSPAQERIRAYVDSLKSDPILREAARRRFDEFRGQSLDDTVQKLLQRFPKIKDAN